MKLIDPAVDAPCVRIYRDIRAGVTGECAQLGYGYNRFPTSPDLITHMSQVFAAACAAGRMSEYGTAFDHVERALAADLLSAYLERPVDADMIAITNGSTEAIEIVMGHLASQARPVLLPLPLYYAFEQALVRTGGVVAGHYRHDGRTHPARQAAGGSVGAVVHVLPNGVTGTLYPDPTATSGLRIGTDVFHVVDAVFAAGRLHDQDPAVRERMADLLPAWGRRALLMTPAKDLSFPGLRAGLLVSGDPALIGRARHEVMSRYASLNPMLSQLILAYLTVLLLDGRPRPVQETLHAWIRGRYRAHRVDTVLSYNAAVNICGHLAAMRELCARNLTVLGEYGCHLKLAEDLLPYGGYSVLPALADPIGDHQQAVTWANAVGRHHKLKLNPALLFGADETVWDALYPQPRIRINLSVPTVQLATDLGRLQAAWPQIAPTRPTPRQEDPDDPRPPLPRLRP